MNRDPKELYQKLKPFLRMGPMDLKELREHYGSYVIDHHALTERENRPKKLYWSHGKDDPNSRPTYDEFCKWYKLPLIPFKVPSHGIVEVEFNAQKD